MRYAQINENGICFAVSNLSGEVIADDMILLKDNEMSPLGKKYVNGMWEEVEAEQEPIVQAPSDMEMIMQSMADLELANLEAQQERQLLAQQLSDLELAVLEGGK